MPKCPRCKCAKLHFLELWTDHSIEWRYGASFDEGVLEMGDPYGVEATCTKCKHQWRLRGVIGIDETWLNQEK